MRKARPDFWCLELVDPDAGRDIPEGAAVLDEVQLVDILVAAAAAAIVSGACIDPPVERATKLRSRLRSGNRAFELVENDIGFRKHLKKTLPGADVSTLLRQRGDC